MPCRLIAKPYLTPLQNEDCNQVLVLFMGGLARGSPATAIVLQSTFAAEVAVIFGVTLNYQGYDCYH